MSIELLRIGVAKALTQNQEYALPARACYINSQGTAASIAPVVGGTYAAIPASLVVAGGFIKSTGTDTTVILKTTG